MAVFMDNLAKYIRHFLDDRVTNTPGWQEFCVIFSDASVPGEVRDLEIVSSRARGWHSMAVHSMAVHSLPRVSTR